MKQLKGVCIGTGYFSQFHYEAWSRIPEVEVAALCSLDKERAQHFQAMYRIPRIYSDYNQMLVREDPDFVDIITPPATHKQICLDVADSGAHIICQKPLTPDLRTSIDLVASIGAQVRFIVHENWRFQPWHREIRTLLDQAIIGPLNSLTFRSRFGDGWGGEAYLDRQPYFREYEQFLIYETGVHFIDTFRYHAGEVNRVYSVLKRLNPVIKGEDAGLMVMEFENGAVGYWDANRYNENNYPRQRLTFGEYVLDGELGTIRLYPDGKLSIQLLGQTEEEHRYVVEDQGFAGDSVYSFQKHAVDCLLTDRRSETEAEDYLINLRIQEAVYQSALKKIPISISN